MSLLKKFALIFPPVRNVQTDLKNRRVRADEFEAANKVLVQRNEELLSNIELMKSQMAKALGLKETAVMAESKLAANAELYYSQLNIFSAKYDKLKSQFEEMETKNCALKLENVDLTRKNAEYFELIREQPIKTGTITKTKNRPATRKRSKKAKKA